MAEATQWSNTVKRILKTRGKWVICKLKDGNVRGHGYSMFIDRTYKGGYGCKLLIYRKEEGKCYLIISMKPIMPLFVSVHQGQTGTNIVIGGLCVRGVRTGSQGRRKLSLDISLSFRFFPFFLDLDPSRFVNS